MSEYAIPRNHPTRDKAQQGKHGRKRMSRRRERFLKRIRRSR